MIENLVSSSADLEFDHPRCECGITGVVTPNGNAAEIAARLNYEQKNRGTQANGIGWFTSGLTINRKLYQNQPIEKNPDVIGIEASMALGHTRYTTEGDGSEENIQPAHATWEDVDGNTQELILSHNGNVNLASIQKLVKKKLPEGASDSVYIAQLIAESHGITMAEKLHNALLELEGSYSLTILSAEGVFGIRDPRGNRPLHFAQYEDGTSILASEDYPLQERSNTQDGYLISIPPGSLVHINPEGQTTIVPEFIEPLEPAF
ncbi:MAG: hypothetical protein O3B87_03655, partial [bacterium]|nr:hypothetical protein [bacterium]